MDKLTIDRFLSMDPVQFDQDENGWRSLVGRVDEDKIATLILRYIEINGQKIDQYNKGKTGEDIFPVELLYFHAGQSFAIAGDQYYQRAIGCFKKGYEPEKECWNAYVDGTIAFLEANMAEVKRQIKIVESSKEKNKRGGNIGILRNFLKCLEQDIKDYEQAYAMPTTS